MQESIVNNIKDNPDWLVLDVGAQIGIFYLNLNIIAKFFLLIKFRSVKDIEI